MLLGGLRKQDYTVMIGAAVCGNIDVQANLIVCEPPQTQPRIPEELKDDNRIGVKVHS